MVLLKNIEEKRAKM